MLGRQDGRCRRIHWAMAAPQVAATVAEGLVAANNWKFLFYCNKLRQLLGGRRLAASLKKSLLTSLWCVHAVLQHLKIFVSIKYQKLSQQIDIPIPSYLSNVIFQLNWTELFSTLSCSFICKEQKCKSLLVSKLASCCIPYLCNRRSAPKSHEAMAFGP